MSSYFPIAAALLFLGFCHAGVQVAAAETQITYTSGLIKLLTNDSTRSVPICMVYPNDYYTLGTTAQKTYNLGYEKTIDLCDDDLTKEDFTPNKPVSLILLSVSRTNCSVSRYIELIREGGSSGVILLSNATRLLNQSYGWDIFSIVQRADISKFLNSADPGEDVKVELFGFQRFDASLIILWLIAVICVTVGSFTGPYRLLSNRVKDVTDQDRETLGDERKEEPNDARMYDGVTIPIALGLVLFISIMLILLYFFYQYLVYFFILVFCIASPRAMYILILQLVTYFTPGVRYPTIWKFGIHEIFFALLSASLPIVWFIYRHESCVWGIQDILGICFCIHLIQTLHLPNMKVITCILVLLFIYDIFFVFITPYFTSNGKSVMVEVATGVSGSGSKEQLPMLLLLPRFQNNPANVCAGRDFSLLGYGDIIVPGFLVCFAHSFDLQNNTGMLRPYFITSVIAYALGLFGAFVALVLTYSGQPALFYIVPSILIGLFSVGLLKKEVGLLWRGITEQQILEQEHT